MEDLFRLQSEETFMFSPENPTGVRGGGSPLLCSKLCPNRRVEPGETYTVMETDRAGVIQHIWLTGKFTHATVLRIYWDGQETPSVETPLSAFFGCVFDKTLETESGDYPTVESAPILLAPSRGCNCYFPMPFRHGCRITLENRGDETSVVYYAVTGVYRTFGENEDIGYFHASYRQSRPVTRGGTYTVIDGIHGAGRFLGVMLGVKLHGGDPCFVEGEARMYIDGEGKPSLHYTGTEDYFGGAYAFGNDACHHRYQPYRGLYAGLTLPARYTSADGRFFLLYRWHIPDTVRFRTEFRMTLDNLGADGARSDEYFSVAYWYQSLPHAPLMPLPSNQDCDPYSSI